MRIITTAAAYPTLYHVTYTSKLEPMLKEFMLSPAFGVELKGNKPYFASFSRLPYNRYAKGSVSSFWAHLVIDGAKLGQHYSFAPVDYWKDTRKFDRDTHKGQSEAEERLVSDKPSIKNFGKYVKEIHVCLPEPKQWKMYGKKVVDLADLVERLDKEYEVHLYFAVKDMLRMRNEVPFDSTIEAMRNAELAPERDFGYDASIKPVNYMGPWRELIEKNSRESLSERAIKLIWGLGYSDSWGNLSADIQNSKRSRNSEEYRDALWVIGWMHKKKMNMRELCKWLDEKWKEVR